MLRGETLMADNPNRIAPLFLSKKRDGLLVSPVTGEGLARLISVIKQAKSEGADGVTLFVWINAEGSKTAGSVTVGVARPDPRAGGGDSRVRSRPIGAAAPAPARAPSALDSLFGGKKTPSTPAATSGDEEDL